jgi:hypothetical protein
MLTLVICAVAIVFGGGGVAAGAYAKSRRQPKPTKCTARTRTHLWGSWCKVCADVQGPMQQRECFICGELQVRRPVPRIESVDDQ